MRFPIVAVTIVLVATMLAGCADSRGNRLKEADEPVEVVPAAEPGAMYIVATDFSTPASEGFYKFRPGEFRFKKDQIVNVTIKNAVGNRDIHNLVIAGYNLKLDGVKDLTASKVFNATQAGTFAFYCDKMYAPSVSHRQVGFEGRLIVS